MGDLQGTPLRSRLALAAGVAAACLGGCLGMASLSSGAPAAQAPAPAPQSVGDHTHSGDLGVPGMSERELRAFEVATLGADHAAEHAQMRRDMSAPAKSRPAEVEKLQQAAAVEAAAVGDASDVGRW